jgi:hypothetical protein
MPGPPGYRSRTGWTRRSGRYSCFTPHERLCRVSGRRTGPRVVPGRVRVQRPVHGDVEKSLAVPSHGAHRGHPAGREVRHAQRPRREVMIALHLDRLVAFGKHCSVPENQVRGAAGPAALRTASGGGFDGQPEGVR